MSAPLILASLGGLVTYHAGIVNVAMEGLMLASAFTAVVFSYIFGSAATGVLAAIIVSILFSMLYSYFVTTLKANNFAIGIAINIFISSLTLFLTRIMFVGQNAFNSPKIKEIPKIKIDFGVEFLNTLLSNYSVLVYLALILTFIISYVIYKTPFGLWLRAAGSHPEALATAGKRVWTVQYATSILTGILCGLAGAQLSLSNVVLFTRDMSAGRGFICLAAILISRGKPKTTLLVAVLFGFFDALSIQLQALKIPTQFLFMLPYVMAILTLVLMDSSARRKRQNYLQDTSKKA
jgi:simple sugar transport system permease protein